MDASGATGDKGPFSKMNKRSAEGGKNYFTWIGHIENNQEGGKTTVHSSPQKRSSKKRNKKPLTNSTEPVTQDQMLDLKDMINFDWKDMGRRFGFEEALLDQLHLQHKDDYRELNYQILLRWKREKPDEATQAKLAWVFVKIGRGDLADILADEDS